MNSELTLPQPTTVRTRPTPLEDTLHALGITIIDRQRVKKYQAETKERRLQEFYLENFGTPLAMFLIGALMIGATVSVTPGSLTLMIAMLYLCGLAFVVGGIGQTARIRRVAFYIGWTTSIVDVGDLKKEDVPERLVAKAWEIHVRHPNARFCIERFEGDPFIAVTLGKEGHYFGNWNTPGFEA